LEAGIHSALASVTGAEAEGPIIGTEAYWKRFEAAAALIVACRECQPEAAVPMPAIAHGSLSPEFPDSALGSSAEGPEGFAMRAKCGERFRSISLSPRTICQAPLTETPRHAA